MERQLAWGLCKADEVIFVVGHVERGEHCVEELAEHPVGGVDVLGFHFEHILDRGELHGVPVDSNFSDKVEHLAFSNITQI